MEGINLEEGLLGVILKDSLSAENLQQTILNINTGTDLFNENMEAMRHHFLFRRYFKKQEKKLRKAQKANKNW